MTTSSSQAPSTWGESTWQFLHCAAESYEPSTDREAMTSLLASLGGTLPCAACRTEWTAFAKAHPPQLATRTALKAWVLAAHNSVNARIGSSPLTAAAARERYTTTSLATRAGWTSAVVVLSVILAVLAVLWLRRGR